MTKYTPEYGKRILDHMSKGFSIAAAAAIENIGRQTVYDWEQKHPEFRELLDLGRSKRQLHLENDLLTTTSGPRVTACLRALGGMRLDEWSETQRLEHTGKDGAPLNADVSLLSAQTLLELKQLWEANSVPRVIGGHSTEDE